MKGPIGKNSRNYWCLDGVFSFFPSRRAMVAQTSPSFNMAAPTWCSWPNKTTHVAAVPCRTLYPHTRTRTHNTHTANMLRPTYHRGRLEGIMTVLPQSSPLLGICGLIAKSTTRHPPKGNRLRLVEVGNILCVRCEAVRKCPALSAM